MTDVVLINVEEGIKRVMNNTKLYAKLLSKFKIDPNMKNIEEAFEAGDIEKAKASVHTLKGLSSNLSFIELTSKTLQLENKIKAGSLDSNSLADVKNIYDLTITEADKVIAQYA